MNQISIITPAQLCELKSEGRTIDLIDVREPEEFQAVRAEGAVSVPLGTVDVDAINAARTAGEGEPIFIICKVGQRSMMACQFLAQEGMTNLVNVHGGTDDWVANGLPTNTGD